MLSGLVTKRLARLRVRDVHLDGWQTSCGNAVSQRHRGVGEAAGIDDDPVETVARLVQPVDELAFLIGLAALDCRSEILRKVF